jgi:ketosteroid isomerase-like protein
MTQENVELAYRANEALNRRDSDAFVACLHPDVVS